MKKIINLVTQMEAGGAQGAAIRMSEQMRNQNIDAETWFFYKKFNTYSNEPHVVVIHDAAPSTPLHALQIIFKTVKLLKKYKPDGLVTYTHYANILGQIAAKLAGIKNRIATIRNPVWTYPAIAGVTDKVAGSMGFYSKIIAVSTTVKRSCKRFPSAYKKRIEVVYNGVPARVSEMSKKEARQKFNLNIDEAILLVNVARLHPQKNQQLLINILPYLPNYHLAIAGDGELKNDLISLSEKLQVAERVHFFGEVNPNEVPDFLRAGDVFLFPSLYEAFGFSIFEAAYNGLPVIASNIPSTVEMLSMEENKKAGIIVENFSVDAWVAAIKTIEDTGIRKRILDNMKEKLLQFNFNKMVDSYIAYATGK